MYNSFFKLYAPYTIFLIIICILILITLNLNSQPEQYSSNDSFPNSNSKFYWPLPKNKTITSHFGKRTSPTSGASSYHSGIDIAASEGTPIYACMSGKVIFTGFKGAGRIYNYHKK